MNLKNRIAHFMKAEGFHVRSVRFGFLDSFLDKQNNLYRQSSNNMANVAFRLGTIQRYINLVK